MDNVTMAAPQKRTCHMGKVLGDEWVIEGDFN